MTPTPKPPDPGSDRERITALSQSIQDFQEALVGLDELYNRVNLAEQVLSVVLAKVGPIVISRDDMDAVPGDDDYLVHAHELTDGDAMVWYTGHDADPDSKTPLSRARELAAALTAAGAYSPGRYVEAVASSLGLYPDDVRHPAPRDAGTVTP